MRAAVEILGPHGRPVGRAWVVRGSPRMATKIDCVVQGLYYVVLHGSMLCGRCGAGFP